MMLGLIKNRIAPLLLVLPLALGIGFAHPPTAHAQLGGLLGGLLGSVTGQRVTVVADTSATSITNTLKAVLNEVSTAAIAGFQSSLNLKEFTLDGIAWSLGKQLINQLTSDVVKWMNSGFNGAPAFVTDLEGFLKNVADRAVVNFIYGPELDHLCTEDISFEVRVALAVEHQESHESIPKCTLADKTTDVEVFLNGEFSTGGFDAFYELVFGENNDPNKAFLNARVEAGIRTLDALGNEQTVLNWGDGFMTQKNCTTVQDAQGYASQKCTNVTPGAILRDTLAFHVGELPALSLLEVDEFNEIVSSLMSNLTTQAFQGLNGILGLGGNAQWSGGGTSYLDALKNDDVSGQQSYSENPIKKAYDNEVRYAELQDIILKAILDLEERVANGKRDYPTCFDFELPDSLIAASTTATSTLSTKAQAEQNITISVVAQEVFLILNDRFTNATTTASKNLAYQQFIKLEQADLVRSEYDNKKLEEEYINLSFAQVINSYRQEIANETTSCQASQ